MDTSILLNELRVKHDFQPTSFERFLPLLEERYVKKNEVLFRERDIVRLTYFVIKGCIRQYYVSPEGVERTIYFAVEGNWCGDLMSFIHEQPTTLNLQALEGCELVTLNRKNWEHAIVNIPDFALYHIKNHQRIVLRLKEELGKSVNETPYDKYVRLTKESPALLQRLPLYHIAAYLGVTPETVSRIRKKMSRQ